MTAQGKTRSTIVDIANALLLTRGFSAFSYKHISEKLGIKNAAVHYHFASKEELGLLLIQQHRRQFLDWVETEDPLAGDPSEALASVCDLRLSYWCNHAQMSPECVLAAEYSCLPLSMQLEVKKLVDDIAGVLSKILSSGKNSGAFSGLGRDYDNALLMIAELNGVQQLARTGNVIMSPALAQRICDKATGR